MQDTLKALCALLIASIIWGMNSYITKLMLPFGSPLSFIIIRFFCSSSLLLAFLIFTKQCKLPKLKHIPILFLLGFFSVCMNNTGVIVGLQYSSVTNFSIINATSPLFIAFFAFIFLREKLLLIQWFGIFLALIGMVYILTDGHILAIRTMQFNKGDIVFLFAQFGWALYTLISSRLLRHISVSELVCYSGFFGVLLNCLYGYFTNDLALPTMNYTVILCLFYAIFLSTIAAIIMWNFGVKTVGASISGIFLNFSTLIGIASGVILLDEPFTIKQIYGVLSVLLGVFCLLQYQLIIKLSKQFAILLHIRKPEQHKEGITS